MGIDWEEMLGVEGDQMAQAYEAAVCDAMALESLDYYYSSYDDYEDDDYDDDDYDGHDSSDFGVTAKAGTAGKYRKRSGYLCKVAGVTFDNSDGENRQEVIKAIIDEKGDGRTWTGQGELKALERASLALNWKKRPVEVRVDGKPVGLVPRESKKTVIEKLKSQDYSVTVKLDHYPEHDIYTAKLYKPT